MLLEKKELRKRMLAERTRYTSEQLALMSSQIACNLWEIPQVEEADRIMGYLSFDRELSLDVFIEQALQKGKSVYVPYIVDRTKSIIAAVELSSLDDVEFGEYGIRVPRSRKVCKPEKLDIVLVPGVAFSLQGARLGMGKGFYDRFLENTTAYLLGVVMECNLLEQVPTELHDKNVDALVTPNKIIDIIKNKNVKFEG